MHLFEHQMMPQEMPQKLIKSARKYAVQLLILWEYRIQTHQRSPINERRSNDHPIRRVTMVFREHGCLKRYSSIDREYLNIGLQSGGNPVGDGHIQQHPLAFNQLPQLPTGNCTDGDPVRCFNQLYQPIR